MEAIGIDAGGTAIKTGLVSLSPRRAQITTRITIPTPRSKKEFYDAILQATNATGGNHAVGIGFPAPITNGIVANAPNLTCFRNANVQKELDRLLGRKVALDNDAACALIAEKHYGEGRKLNLFIVLTLGTGIGGAAWLDGEIMRMEPGHMTIGAEWLERKAGAHGMLDGMARNGLPVRNIEELAALQRKGNPLAQAAMKHAAVALAESIQQLSHALRPQAIILTGGVSKWSALVDKTRAEMSILHWAVPKPKIITSKLEDAGIIGAAMLCEGKK